ncbi:MAG: hypothetical protein MUE33_09715 [Cytophagaceae bacterium]|jgi:hypothetical protein|nr:hypothetical protein [Cytophagaceae bacterium]
MLQVILFLTSILNQESDSICNRKQSESISNILADDTTICYPKGYYLNNADFFDPNSNDIEDILQTYRKNNLQQGDTLLLGIYIRDNTKKIISSRIYNNVYTPSFDPFKDYNYYKSIGLDSIYEIFHEVYSSTLIYNDTITIMIQSNVAVHLTFDFTFDSTINEYTATDYRYIYEGYKGKVLQDRRIPLGRTMQLHEFNILEYYLKHTGD